MTNPFKYIILAAVVVVFFNANSIRNYVYCLLINSYMYLGVDACIFNSGVATIRYVIFR